MKTDVLLLDCNALCYAAKFGMPPTLSYEDIKTEIIFGFMNKVFSYAKMFQPEHFVFAWDSRKNFRKKVYPPYKAKRNKQREEKTEEEKEIDAICYKQFSEIRSIVLPSLGFKNIFLQTGYEADDVIASFVHNNPDLQIVTISSDEDLYQLITKNHMILSSSSAKRAKTTTYNSFKAEWGIEPKEWGMVKSIAGCISDEVEGIEGVGNKKAVQYLKGKMNPTSKILKRIQESGAIIERNKPLVILPYEGTKVFPLQEDELWATDFMNIFENYGFRTYLRNDNFQDWERLFNLK